MAAGDLPGLQAAVGLLQHPEQELDVRLRLEGEAAAMAPLHRAASGGKETCLKVGQGVWLWSSVAPLAALLIVNSVQVSL